MYDRLLLIIAAAAGAAGTALPEEECVAEHERTLFILFGPLEPEPLVFRASPAPTLQYYRSESTIFFNSGLIMI